LKFYSIFLTDESLVDKENLIWRRKVQNQMFMDSIKFYWRFNWIYRGFDYKKNCLVNFGFIWKKLKFRGPITIYPRTWLQNFRILVTKLKMAISHFKTASFQKTLFITFFITLGQPFQQKETISLSCPRCNTLLKRMAFIQL